MSIDRVAVTRRADGARFEIIAQSRSLDGPVTLRAVAPPHDTHEVRGRDFDIYYADPRKPDVVRHPPDLHAVEIEPGAWGVNHHDGAGNVWSACECGHGAPDEAISCARGSLTHSGRIAFETYNHCVGGVTWDGKPIPGWDAVTEAVRDGWRMAAFATRHRQTLL